MKIKVINKNECGLPVYKHSDDAGCDLIANEDAVLRPFERKAIATGLSLQLPTGTFAHIFPRSGRSLNKCTSLKILTGETADSEAQENEGCCSDDFDTTVVVFQFAGWR